MLRGEASVQQSDLFMPDFRKKNVFTTAYDIILVVHL